MERRLKEGSSGATSRPRRFEGKPTRLQEVQEKKLLSGTVNSDFESL